MNCWKTVNVTREFGLNRIYLISLLTGLMSFIFLYLPFSIVHQTNELKDHGLLPLLIGLILLPMVHKLTHILPLFLVKKRLKMNWRFKIGLFPTFSFLTNKRMSKKTSITILLAPTVLITIPGLISSYLFAEYHAYILLFTSVNIGLSFTDFLYTSHIIKAPKKCIIENAKNGYDILIG
ncbi:DUF3267 domain-containing protein [Aquibacillus saliphilus]|uniref:DUF3267 domain-containing protein n=1 Tax=Aquibacillus saliphilus TaxID=1909422 RepID=UPI001CF097AC|nr:DUF3267 domain-containing protein [Aquibacillus saliphilus]